MNIADLNSNGTDGEVNCKILQVKIFQGCVKKGMKN